MAPGEPVGEAQQLQAFPRAPQRQPGAQEGPRGGAAHLPQIPLTLPVCQMVHLLEFAGHLQLFSVCCLVFILSS